MVILLWILTLFQVQFVPNPNHPGEMGRALLHNLIIQTARKGDYKLNSPFVSIFISPFLCSLKETQLFFFFPSFVCFKFENKNTIDPNYGFLHFSCWFAFSLTLQVSTASNWKVLISFVFFFFWVSRTKRYLRRQFQHHNRHLFDSTTQTLC